MVIISDSASISRGIIKKILEKELKQAKRRLESALKKDPDHIGSRVLEAFEEQRYYEKEIDKLERNSATQSQLNTAKENHYNFMKNTLEPLLKQAQAVEKIGYLKASEKLARAKHEVTAIEKMLERLPAADSCGYRDSLLINDYELYS